MIREAKIADSPGLSLSEQEIEHAVLDVTVLILLHPATHADRMKEEVVQIVDLQLLERVVVHGNGGFSAPGLRGEVG